MHRKILPFRWSHSFIAIALVFFGCGGMISEKDLSAEKQALSDTEFVASIKQQIDDQVTHQDAMNDIEKVRGKVVKWSGDIIKIWNDKLLIACPKKEGGWNHFILIIDHPLPQESPIEDLIQTASTGDVIFVAGRIIDIQTVILETGSDLTIPHLKCYVISKENDRQFAKPMWIAHEI